MKTALVGNNSFELKLEHMRADHVEDALHSCPEEAVGGPFQWREQGERRMEPPLPLPCSSWPKMSVASVCHVTVAGSISFRGKTRDQRVKFCIWDRSTNLLCCLLYYYHVLYTYLFVFIVIALKYVKEEWCRETFYLIKIQTKWLLLKIYLWLE